MPDLYITDTADLTVSANGDLAITETAWRIDAQQAYVRALTDVSDYLLYPTLGASLSSLYGMPQAPSTGSYGVGLIRAALDREGVFTGKSYTVTAVPIGPQAIRFDINITSGSQEEVVLSVVQNLGVS